MNVAETHAKAFAAFAASLSVSFALMVISFGDAPTTVMVALAVSLATACLTAAAVAWVPNKANGHNVFYIASILIDRGIAPAGKPKRFDDG